MTPPSAGEEEANSRHGEKTKIRSKINLFISGYVKPDPLPEDTDPYGECFYVSSPYSSALPRTSAGAPSVLHERYRRGIEMVIAGGSTLTSATASSKARGGHGSGSPPTNATASARISPEARDGWWKAILTEWNALLE